MDAFVGFVREDFVERDVIQSEVERLRRERDSFKSDLQTQVEAEARIIVEAIRSGRFSLPERSELTQAFFVSNSRVVDHFDDTAERITMRPEAALQWLTTVQAPPPEQLAALFDSVLSELEEAGVGVVNAEELVNAFSPLLDASKRQLRAELDDYELLTAREYGEDTSKAYRDELDSPVIAKSHLVQRLYRTEGQLVAEQASRKLAEKQGALTEKDAKDLDRLKRQKAERSKTEKSRQRSVQSRRKGSRRRKGKG
jgi:hypothetical protein